MKTTLSFTEDELGTLYGACVQAREVYRQLRDAAPQFSASRRTYTHLEEQADRMLTRVGNHLYPDFRTEGVTRGAREDFHVDG